MKTLLLALAAAAILIFAASCSRVETSVVAVSDRQWTGLAIGDNNRMFVCYPYWSDDVPVSVAEIKNGQAVPYPDAAWNDRNNKQSFYAVQSVVADSLDRLWVVDTNNPKQKGVRPGGPVLYCFDLKNNKLLGKHTFDPAAYDSKSYYNDIRIDTEHGFVYLTDSGSGGIIVLNLNNGQSRRVLHNHYSVKAEEDSLVCDGYTWKNAVHSDGIALSPDREYLYFAALTGHTLYRIKTKYLQNFKLKDLELETVFERLNRIPATDGMLFGKDGRLWLGGLEDNSINVRRPSGEIKKVVKSPEIRWPDSFAMDSEDNLYFTTSQIHLPPDKRGPYTIQKFSTR